MSRKFVPAFMLIILIGVGVVFMWYYLGKQSAVEQVREQETREQGISNWQTYHSEEYGFEVQYPGNWRIEEEGFITPASHTFGIPVALAYTGPEGFNPLGFVIFGNQDYSNATGNSMFVRIDVLQRLTSYPSYEPGEQDVIYKHISQYYNPDGESVTLTTSFLKKDILFQLEGYSHIYSEENETLLRQILATFLFIDGSAATTVPKTCTECLNYDSSYTSS